MLCYMYTVKILYFGVGVMHTEYEATAVPRKLLMDLKIHQQLCAMQCMTASHHPTFLSILDSTLTSE